MKSAIILAGLAIIASLSGSTPEPQDEAVVLQNPAVAEHEWLQALVGEWNTVSTFNLGPDKPPMRSKGTYSIRPVGKLWTVADGKFTVGGRPYATVMTLGFDTAKKRFVGTWVDSVSTYLWTYDGSLDESKKALTLSTTGPSFEDPTKMAKFREVLAPKTKDHWVHSAFIETDGKWVSMGSTEFRRKER